MRWILSIPLFAYVVIAANIVMLTGPVDQSMLNVILYELTLPSSRAVVLTISDAFILGSLFILYIEVFKATRVSTGTQIEHALSLVVFIVALIQFLIIPRLGNVTFLIIMLAALMDVVIGFTVTISTAKRDFNFGSG
ncbi:MAG: hypothetical protein AB8B64_16630 [Granulosicoccus sp.]